MNRVVSYVVSQFHHPRGLVGQLVGTVMAAKNRDRNLWVVSILEVEPRDRVLEIGYGPGVAISEVARLAPQGLVAGIDISEVMWRQANRRNQAAIRDGRVDLRVGTVEALPFENAAFDKVFTVNSFHVWPDKLHSLREIERTLQPGGRLAIAEQHPTRHQTEDELDSLRQQLSTYLMQTGFQDMRWERKDMAPSPVVGVLGLKPLKSGAGVSPRV